jgi:division protein CdvB (Snf7/Vps24/ESCRT-III family)
MLQSLYTLLNNGARLDAFILRLQHLEDSGTQLQAVVKIMDRQNTILAKAGRKRTEKF